MSRPDSIVRLEAVTRRYTMGHTLVCALDGVDLEIARGDYLVITGPSGSGKSTLLHVLGLLDRPDQGQVVYRGKNVRSFTDRELSAVRNAEIGFVFQSFNLLPEQTALQNAMLPLIYARGAKGQGNKARARAALEQVGLAQRAAHRPAELSGGEQQRCAIARALVKRPALILADEPTGNLDSASGAGIMAIFDDLAAQGIAVVLITHDPAVAAHGRRQLQILDGRIVKDQARA